MIMINYIVARTQESHTIASAVFYGIARDSIVI